MSELNTGLHSVVFPDENQQRAPDELLRAFRPIERLLAKGPMSLTQGELVSLVLGRGGSSRRIAQRLVRRFGLRGMSAVPAPDWLRESGLGRSSAARLSAVFEIGRRVYGQPPSVQRPALNRPREAFRLVRHLARAKKEHLVGLYLDAQNGLLHQETVSIGSLNTTRTHPREILFPAIAHLALGFILVHNHPSGNPDPSPEDLQFTRAVSSAGELMGIELYDHLIVAGEGYTSLRERGLL